MPGNFYVLESGSVQRPVRFDGVYDGGSVRPVYEPNPTYATGTRLARVQPFSSDSAFNVAMGSGATFETSSNTMTAALLAVATPYINRENWSMAVYQADLEDPYVTITHPTLFTTQGTAWIPADAVPTGGTDKHVAVIQPDGRTVYEIYAFTRVSDVSVTSTFVVRNDMHGTGLTAGTRASGTSILGGLIRAIDITNGVIPHTLTMGLGNENLLSGFVWPARSQDSDAATAYTGTIPLGTMFAIPPSVNLNSIGLTTSAGLMLATCMQDYGGHVMIRSDEVTLFAELNASSSVVSDMRTDFPTIRNQLRRVTNNTAGNISGGGTRRQPTAADLYNPMFGTPMTPQ